MLSHKLFLFSGSKSVNDVNQLEMEFLASIVSVNFGTHGTGPK